jgi:hypothetical protein
MRCAHGPARRRVERPARILRSFTPNCRYAFTVGVRVGHACVTVFALLFGSGAARADPAATPLVAFGGAEPPLDPRRFELAALPILGGNSDIGFQLGLAATLARFDERSRPYLWDVNLLLSASAKDDADGFRFVQQSHVLRLDAPDLFGGRVRLDARALFQRTINAEYFGLGNATTAARPAGPGGARRYQYIQEEGWVRGIARVHTGTVFDLAIAVNARAERPDVYPSSKLAEDLAGGSPIVLGGQPAFLGTLTGGFIVDTRDSELVARRGLLYQVGAAGTLGSAEGVAYGEASAALAHYAPLGPTLVFASRFIASARFGRLPFYDQQVAGAFEQGSVLGGMGGVRGVPQGRYAGLVKAIANFEVRSTPFPPFRLLGQEFLFGTTTFFDAGRVWSGPGVVSAADGTSLGLKYGVGAGVFVRWGHVAIFRIEVAYSPDAVSENPGLPLGVYVADGLMF